MPMPVRSLRLLWFALAHLGCRTRWFSLGEVVPPCQNGNLGYPMREPLSMQMGSVPSRVRGSMEYIETESELEIAEHRLQGERLIAVDMEAAGFHCYEDSVVLMQLSTGHMNLVYDI